MTFSNIHQHQIVYSASYFNYLWATFSNTGANHKLRAIGSQLQEVAIQKIQVVLMIDADK